ncbi:helix-turn-helix domain-containing protein [Glaciecola sp. 1036]|uniref:helix-turn-helix domain-containing protein n=1 Tax=Alteromonadaceae TaxID=72275 RepID=UPI003D0131F4
MLDYYKKVLIALLCVLTISAILVVFCIDRIFLDVSMLPQESSEIKWQAHAMNDEEDGGDSLSQLKDARYSLDFEFEVSDKIEFPYSAVALEFLDNSGNLELANLSKFTDMYFVIKCTVPNEMIFMAFTIDDNITRADDFLTYRSPNAYFSCPDDWQRINIDLTRLEVPQWWLAMFNLKLSMNEYSLEKVAKFHFATTLQTPKEVYSRVQISEIHLTGVDENYIYILSATLFVLWASFFIWVFRQHSKALTGDLKRKFLQERPLVAYRQLSIEPRHDKEQNAILQLMATEYANPELNLDFAVSETGTSRTKINEILKSELGLTFTGYLNKLRLTEAARLLSEVEDANIAEIAYSVGYKNVSYFNKLFKEEYGCTPKAFKSYL